MVDDDGAEHNSTVSSMLAPHVSNNAATTVAKTYPELVTSLLWLPWLLANTPSSCQHNGSSPLQHPNTALLNCGKSSKPGNEASKN